jgi:hypothetical protein
MREAGMKEIVLLALVCFRMRRWSHDYYAFYYNPTTNPRHSECSSHWTIRYISYLYEW